MTGERPRTLGAWRFVVTFGFISLLSDFVYEGARSITGPLLAHLGATAVVVGVVTGVGEGAALVLRLVSGPLADRTKRFWGWVIAGYAVTFVSVPTLGLTGTLWVACALVIAERVGKAVRSPAKDTLLSYATSATGRGRGFAVQEAMDQVGAVIGPLVVALMLIITGGQYAPSLAVLALPAVAALALLVWLRARVPEPVGYETSEAAHAEPTITTGPHGRRLPRAFWEYSGFTAMTMTGFATFGVLSFHMVERDVLPAAAVPLLYAGVMAVDAIVALGTGWAYDRFGPRVLLLLPLIAAAVPVLAFTDVLASVVAGSLLWGAALGIQESTLRATVADLVPPDRRGTAYGIYAAIVGVATAVGGIMAGALYGVSITALIIVTLVIQAAAVVTFALLFVRPNGRKVSP
ncbi:MFS transporter [Homoserinimonas sp. OAct 916]|uniref:MFS transporter n=1 Tax=Homoserinimonas sp. OAct 916 TaxID=2211450 RepID=UPI000DBE1FDC|nr:MFS transporter [Homoserinimonas sp. OAct 916]